MARTGVWYWVFLLTTITMASREDTNFSSEQPVEQSEDKRYHRQRSESLPDDADGILMQLASEAIDPDKMLADRGLDSPHKILIELGLDCPHKIVNRLAVDCPEKWPGVLTTQRGNLWGVNERENDQRAIRNDALKRYWFSNSTLSSQSFSHLNNWGQVMHMFIKPVVSASINSSPPSVPYMH